MVKHTVGWELERKKALILWEKYEYEFPSFSQYNRFCCISCATGDYWGNTYISHMLKHTIGQEMDEKKVTTPSEKYEYQLPRFSRTMGFVAFSCVMRNWSENPCISHMMRFVNFFLWIRLEKSTHTIGKEWVPNSQVPTYDEFCCILQYFGKLMGRPMPSSWWCVSEPNGLKSLLG